MRSSLLAAFSGFVLTACPAPHVTPPGEPTSPAPGGSARASAGAHLEPAALPGPAPKAPEPTAELALGKDVLLPEGKAYRVGDAGLVLRQTGARMAHASTSDGNDTEYVVVTVEVWLGADYAALALYGGRPVEWRGYHFVASEIGFTWGKSDVTLRVSR